MNNKPFKLKNYLFLPIIISVISCKQPLVKENVDDANTTIYVSNFDYNFGTIKRTDSVTHKFYVQNTGTLPLVIKNVKTSCGCTLPHWSSKPVLSGDSAEIVVVFKPNSSPNQLIKKSIIIEANIDSMFKVLYLSGNISN